jgi:hypothetical protein
MAAHARPRATGFGRDRDALAPLNLDRVSLDDFTVHRLSATLHCGHGDHPSTRQSPWWVYLACGTLPGRYDVSPLPVQLLASTVSGRSVQGEVRIVARQDDGYGTQLILAGLGPLPDHELTCAPRSQL